MTSSLSESLLEEDHEEGILFMRRSLFEVGFSKINSMIRG